MKNFVHQIKSTVERRFSHIIPPHPPEKKKKVMDKEQD